MSLISNIESYENLARRVNLSHLISQFSGVLVVDYSGNILGDVNYRINDYAVSFNEARKGSTGPFITNQTSRCWALPGYIIETLKSPQIDAGIQLPTLPAGAVLTKPKDILLVTTIPLYWYPSVPGGDRLTTYDLRFDIPFLEVKNNRQYFKVAQTNLLEEGTMIIQLSNYPAGNINLSSTGTLDVAFG